jgi:hypothetical protein
MFLFTVYLYIPFTQCLFQCRPRRFSQHAEVGSITVKLGTGKNSHGPSNARTFSEVEEEQDEEEGSDDISESMLTDDENKEEATKEAAANHQKKKERTV